MWIEGGETEEEMMIHVDILENQATDASNQLTRVCYSPDFVSPFPGPGWAGPDFDRTFAIPLLDI